MSSLKMQEKIIFEKLFDRGGYVLNFNDRTYKEYFNEYSINIDNQKYLKNGTSKMKRLRAFWEIEDDKTVGKLLSGLLNYADLLEKINQDDKNKAQVIINRLLGKETTQKTEAEFLHQEFSKLDLLPLNLDSQFEIIITQRIDEIKKTLHANAALSVIFLCGSTLEGLLLDLAAKNPQRFNSSKSAPKSKEDKVKPLHDWSLENLINVAYEEDFIELDIKKYSHNLRDFRNYIHPRQQASQKFNPDKHTAKISWQVLQATIASLSGQR